MKNTVVAKAESPDGTLVAVLVDPYYQVARVADGFFLIVVPNGQDVNLAISARDIGDSSALVATWANKVQIRWQDNSTLLVICDSCGLRAIDISKKLDHIGPTRIIYQGFPKGTAYSSDGSLSGRWERCLEHVKKSGLSISAPRVFSALHSR